MLTISKVDGCAKESFLKGKDQYNWPPCTNYFASAVFYSENYFLHIYKTDYLNKEVNGTEPSHSGRINLKLHSILDYFYSHDLNCLYLLQIRLAGSMWTGNTKGGKYHCTIDLLFDCFGISCIITDNFCFYLQNRLIKTSQTGDQWYSDTSPCSIPYCE